MITAGLTTSPPARATGATRAGPLAAPARGEAAARGAPLSRAWLAWLAAGATLAAFLVAPLWLARWPLAGGPVCALRALTGLPCPACGLTRALTALAVGDWRQSFALHPWALALVLQGVGAWAMWAAWLAGRLRTRPDRWLPRAAALNVAALVVLWLVRLATRMTPG